MVIGLFGDVVPKTVLNFKTLAEGTVVRGSTYCLNGCMEIVNRFPHLMWRIILQHYMHHVCMLVCTCRYCALQVRDGKRLTYEGVRFHRIIRDFIVQGGDITQGNGYGGTIDIQTAFFNF